MTNDIKEYAANKLANTKYLLADGKCLPKIFIVDKHCYWYLNAAKRAAYGTNHPIEMLTINEAFEIITRLPATAMRHENVAWDFDQTGSTFNGDLFCDNTFIKPFMVDNKFIGNTELITDAQDKIEEKNRKMILEALKNSHFNKRAASTYLGISLRSLTMKMKQYNIELTPTKQ